MNLSLYFLLYFFTAISVFLLIPTQAKAIDTQLNLNPNPNPFFYIIFLIIK